MSHEVENMFSVGSTPWHGLGTVLNQAPTTAEAIKLAGLDWTVSAMPVFTADGTPCDMAQAMVRSTDKRVLGVTGSSYQPFQNADAFSWFDPFLHAGEASLETAGSLRGGARVFILAKLARDPSVIVPGDEVLKFILLSNAHDGKQALRVGFTPIRVVCANTLVLAHNAGTSKLIKVSHTSGMVQTLEAIRDVMNTANAAFEASAEQYRFLATRSICESDLKKYIKAVFSQPTAPSTGLVLHSEEKQERKSRVFDDVQRLFMTGRGNQLPGVRGTYWAAFNAVTEYVAHERGSDQATRVDHTWFGTGAAINAKALSHALAMAAA
jgi:phage/plasmid-like protein (TIGR03299 family)